MVISADNIDDPDITFIEFDLDFAEFGQGLVDLGPGVFTGPVFLWTRYLNLRPLRYGLCVACLAWAGGYASGARLRNDDPAVARSFRRRFLKIQTRPASLAIQR